MAPGPRGPPDSLGEGAPRAGREPGPGRAGALPWEKVSERVRIQTRRLSMLSARRAPPRLGPELARSEERAGEEEPAPARPPALHTRAHAHTRAHNYFPSLHSAALSSQSGSSLSLAPLASPWRFDYFSSPALSLWVSFISALPSLPSPLPLPPSLLPLTSTLPPSPPPPPPHARAHTRTPRWNGDGKRAKRKRDRGQRRGE